jgi:hypothetical protein
MNKKSYLACLLVLAAGAALLMPALADATGKEQNGVRAIWVGSPAAVASGPPGAYFISEDRARFHLRCPCGKCTKHNVLPLEAGGGPYVWTLTGDKEKPTLSPSIHWFEPDGQTTHWHGWLQDGYYRD